MEDFQVKKSHRLFAVAAAAALSVVSIAAFAGCETNNPEITITYEFNGTEYEVDYILSRKGAPQTVRHFIELSDAGYYDGTVIHNYQSSGAFMYGGGYTWNADADSLEDQLVERDYWSWVKAYEEENDYKFTQSVYYADEPTYTVYGEFSENGCTDNSQKYAHSYSLSAGALVMYYTDKGSDNTRVEVVRSDNGSNNEGESSQWGNYYKYNCATSLFYTWTGTGSRADLDSLYCVFGHAKDFSQLQDILDAVSDYETTYLTGDEESFTEELTVDNVNQYDPINNGLVSNAKIPGTYNVPVVPIYIKSVKVTKY